MTILKNHKVGTGATSEEIGAFAFESSAFEGSNATSETLLVYNTRGGAYRAWRKSDGERIPHTFASTAAFDTYLADKLSASPRRL